MCFVPAASGGQPGHVWGVPLNLEVYTCTVHSAHLHSAHLYTCTLHIAHLHRGQLVDKPPVRQLFEVPYTGFPPVAIYKIKSNSEIPPLP